MGNGRKLIASAWRVMPPVPVSLGRKAFASALGPPLALLSAAALALAAAGALAPGAGAARAFVLLNLAVYLAGVGVLNVHDRLLVSPVPLFLVLSARGVETASARLMPERGFAAATLVLAGLAPVASYALVEAPRFLPYADEAIELRSAGLFVRDRFPPGHKLMTPLPTIAYYARGDAYHPDVVDMPWLPDSELVAFAAARDVDVVAAPERFLASIGHPARGLLRPDAPPNGLGLLGVWGTTPDRVCLYALDAARRGDP
jgi:hypothetical protein